MATWQVQQAKSKLSEVIERARTEGPQTITRHGKARAVVLSAEAYELMANGAKPARDFKHFLLYEGPKVDALDIMRDEDTGRDIELE